jgi:hypothetical protein
VLITLYLALAHGSGLSSSITRASGVVLLAGLYGLWKLVKGVIYLVRPQSEHKSIPDSYDLSGAKRPTEFKSLAGTRLYLVTYNRKKE